LTCSIGSAAVAIVEISLISIGIYFKKYSAQHRCLEGGWVGKPGRLAAAALVGFRPH
jgi:hypothetical protein